MSTIWTASGRCSSAKFQIQGAPSPSTTRRATRSTHRRSSSRSTRLAKSDGTRSVSRVAMLSMAPLHEPEPGSRQGDRPCRAPRPTRRSPASLPVSWRNRRPACRRVPPSRTCASARRCRPVRHRASSPWPARIDHLKFVAGDIPTERLGMAFHLLGADLKTGQLAQRGAGMAEAHLAGRDAHHAPTPPGESEAFSRPSARSRGLNPRPQAGQ